MTHELFLSHPGKPLRRT